MDFCEPVRCQRCGAVLLEGEFSAARVTCTACKLRHHVVSDGEQVRVTLVDRRPRRTTIASAEG